MELLTLCRSCMVEVASWELQKFDGSALEKFTFCTNIEVSEDDKLPKQFCRDCKMKIQSSYTFIKKAHEVNEIFKTMLSSSEEINVTVKTENLVNDMHYNESSSLTLAGFSYKVKTDDNKKQMFSPTSNQHIEYKMEFDTCQASLENSENELDESLSKEYQMPEMKLNSSIDFSENSDKTHNDDQQIVQKIISKYDSNCTSNNKRNKKKKNTIRQKVAPKLEISSRRKTNHHITSRINKSNKSKTTEKRKVESSDENFFKCDICKKRYKYKIVLQKHIQNKHLKTRKEKDSDRSKVQEETRHDTNPVMNTCDICNRTFKSTLWFSRHMNEHSDSRIYYCKHCPKSFSSYNAYRYHEDQHPESRRFACGECGARFRMGKQLAAHALAQAHARAHVCTKCGAAFETKSSLTSHADTHVNERRFLCGTCGFSAKLANTLNTHMLTHTGAKPFLCKECTFRTTTVTGLRRHELRHRGERPHACHHCGKRFYELGSVEKHIRQVHTRECPYQCYLCPQAFTDAWKCKLHIKRAHSIPLEEIPRISKNRKLKKETDTQTA